MNKDENDYVLMVAKRIKFINQLGGKCKHCNEDRFYMLEFHHVDRETKEFSSFHKQKEKEDVYLEMKKCILLCSNCHRKEHSLIISNDTRSIKNKNILLQFVDKISCEKCGYNDCKSSLSFHHIESSEKDFCIGNIKIRLNSIADIETNIRKELEKCIVICENCHKKIHYNYEKYEQYKDEIMKRIETHKPYNKIDEQRVIQLKKENKSYSQISKEFGCSKSSINYILKKYNLL